jgi:hypothetical protein
VPDAARCRAMLARREPVVWRAFADPADASAWQLDSMRARWGHAPATLRWFTVDPDARRMRFSSLCTRTESTRLGDAVSAVDRATTGQRECPYLRVSDAHGALGSSLARLPFPREVDDPDGWSLHETVLRIGPRDYVYPLHCDNLETVLMQLHGAKEVVLFAPDDIGAMYPRDEDATRSAIDDLDAPDHARFPRFVGAQRWECLVEPGDAIYIPALWFHEVRARGGTVSASRTWRRRDHRGYVDSVKPDAWRAWELANRRVY